jgi:hypothetical protein
VPSNTVIAVSSSNTHAPSVNIPANQPDNLRCSVGTNINSNAPENGSANIKVMTSDDIG